MKAVYISEFGSVDDLEIREVADPRVPTESEVLVRVRAAGLNRADLLQLRGLYPPPPGFSPNIPGLEFAGEIAAIGKGVKGWTVGDRVFGITAGEGQSEYLLTDERLLAKIPDDLDLAAAAAVPEAFITAQDAIFTCGGLRHNETILIHAVGSGVGLAALQLAKANGSKVIGTSRTTEKLDRCISLGLDHAIVTGSNPDFASTVKEITEGRGVDVILDLVGAAYFKQNIDSLALKGRLVLVGLISGSVTEFNLAAVMYKRASIIGTVLRARSVEEKAAATDTFTWGVLPLFESGVIKPNVDRVFELTDVKAAYKYLGSNESFGKVVLTF